MIPTNPRQALGRVLVVGGCGSLGHLIVDDLFDGYDCRISVLDRDITQHQRNERDDIHYFIRDITSLEYILPIFRQIKPQVVVHVVGDVEGTRNVIEACVESGVKGLVYMSSVGASGDEGDALEGERLVLAANRSPSLLTVSLRPAGVVGEDTDEVESVDPTVVSPVLVAHAHCLAVCMLMSTSKLSAAPSEEERVDGAAFIVTNIAPSPIQAWDYAKAI